MRRYITISIPNPLRLWWSVKSKWEDIKKSFARLRDYLDRRPYRVVEVVYKKGETNPCFSSTEVDSEPGYFVWNVIIGEFNHIEALLFCGPYPRTLIWNQPYRILHISGIEDWASLLTMIKPPDAVFDPLFSSASQARKNGWKDRPIEMGWSEIVIKKRHIKIYMLRIK